MGSVQLALAGRRSRRPCDRHRDGSWGPAVFHRLDRLRLCMDPSHKLQQALELMAFGYQLQQQNIRRRHPDWDEQQVLAAFKEWLIDRPIERGLVARELPDW